MLPDGRLVLCAGAGVGDDGQADVASGHRLVTADFDFEAPST